MESIYFWPDNPVASLAALYAASAILLWAARTPMLQLLHGLGSSLDSGFNSMSTWCKTTAEAVRSRAHAVLLAAGKVELQGKMAREFHRIDQGFSDRLSNYSELHRKLDDLLQGLDNSYKECGVVPPDVPGWASTVETISQLPTSGDPNVQKVMESIRKSLLDAEKKALHSHREDASRRHKLLGGMLSPIKEIKSLMGRMQEAVTRSLETTTKINGYVDEYEQIRKSEEEANRALTYSAIKLFIISVIVLGIAVGGAFINFNLIALPMSELVPAGARVGGLPVATVSALVIVLMEAVLGIFIMDMLGITELFPRLAAMPISQRRMILGVSLGGLFFLASVESSLAILREQIVAADAALKMSLAGVENTAVMNASTSKIPVIGQAVLGFVLPWILAMVAVPLEMLLDSGRHVSASLAALTLSVVGNAVKIAGHVLNSVFKLLPNLYDAYIAIPLRIERMVQGNVDNDGISGSDRRGTQGGTA